jgi:hypothetical protein
MKSQIFILVFVFSIVAGFTQNRAIIAKVLQDRADKRDIIHQISGESNQPVLPFKTKALMWEETIGITWYDLQSNGSQQNRLHLFDDGTMGAVYTFMNEPLNWHTGTGYNYFDGDEWGPLPTAALEDLKSYWPAYAPFGENGEIIVSHISGSEIEKGLNLLKRDNKGTGDWEHSIFEGPEGFEEILFPRIATGGVNNSMIHLLAITHPGMSLYQGQDPALLYSRSVDGGITWDPENTVIPEINDTYYLGFGPDLYDIRADGENVAILIGGPWIDLVLLKSTDSGENWERTVIWQHPFPFFDPSSPIVTDTFYCVDGSHNLDFDNEGKVHVAFGINRTYADDETTHWFPAVGGIGYWNENRPTFSDDMNALNPYNHPDSELIEDYSLIGWSQDINGNDSLDILDDWGTYYLGFSSMPQIYMDDADGIFIVYSSVTEGYDNDVQSYRHLWIRFSPNGNWWGPHLHLTGDLVHIFDECVFPSLAYCNMGWSELELRLLYQHDNEPGMAVKGDEDPYGQNYMSILSDLSIPINVPENRERTKFIEISQNHPNPFHGNTTIQIKLNEPANLQLEITGITGEKMYEEKIGYLNIGTHLYSIDVPFLAPGIYFYSINDGNYSMTKKMVVK